MQHVAKQDLVPSLLATARQAHSQQRYDAALQALDTALQLQPTCSDALWMRAAAHAALQHHMASFMDLRTLSTQQPAYPGLSESLQRAAHTLAQQQASRTTATAPPRKTYVRTTRRGSSSSSSTSHNTASGSQQLQDDYATLGLSPGASLAAVRQAYKQLAAHHHPDSHKWVTQGPDAQAAAAERFKQVAAAYQSIVSSQR